MYRITSVIVAIVIAAAFNAPASAQDEPEMVIKDNSFLIEEAYNQEPGVVQWILTAQHTRSPHYSWESALTHEYPLKGMRHQLSVTLPFSATSASHLGIGDVAVHYRFQAKDGSDGTAIAPRATVIFPTGKENLRGEGVLSWQANLPVSIDLSRTFVVHANAGGTLTPNREVKSLAPGASTFHDLTSYTFGGSMVWLATANLNLLCELIYSDTEAVDEFLQSTYRSNDFTINPGLRIAINTSHGQFVPGIAIPMVFDDEITVASIFGYLSFEHSL